METSDRRILDLGIVRKFDRGESLFHAGDKAEHFYLVLSGEVRVFKMDARGNEVEVVRLRAGDYFGEAALFASAAYPAFARAVRETTVRYFAARDVFRRIDRDPKAAGFFLELLARKCLVLNEKVEALGLRTVRQRLARFILARVSADKECHIRLEIGKAELARELGTIPETLSRAFRKLRQEGLIEVRGNTILVKNPVGLGTAS
jgi:CRP/FNR family transcriptional regulator, dissimilatory nitrate respiration regulator